MKFLHPNIFYRKPKILYKYRDWESKFHKNVLLKGEFYLANPKSFEDEYDCNIPLDFESIRDKDIRRRYLYHSKQINPHFSKNEHKQFVEHWFKKGMLRNVTSCRQIEKEHFDKFDKQAGVLSLALERTISQMWEKYADNFKGYCIGIDFDGLRKKTNLLDSYGYVRYKNKLPSISPLVNDKTEIKTWTTQISTKLKKWAFEKEYRVFRMSYRRPLAKHERIIKIPPKYIKEIILGNNMNDEIKQYLIKLSSKKFINAKIYLAEEINGIIDIKENINE